MRPPRDYGRLGRARSTPMMIQMRPGSPCSPKSPLKAKKASPWTVDRVVECTREKIVQMEDKEPSLCRFLLVHKFLQSVDCESPTADMPAMSISRECEDGPDLQSMLKPVQESSPPPASNASLTAAELQSFGIACDETDDLLKEPPEYNESIPVSPTSPTSPVSPRSPAVSPPRDHNSAAQPGQRDLPARPTSPRSRRRRSSVYAKRTHYQVIKTALAMSEYDAEMSRPPKKRRLKLLLGDSGCFAGNVTTV